MAYVAFKPDASATAPGRGRWSSRRKFRDQRIVIGSSLDGVRLTDYEALAQTICEIRAREDVVDPTDRSWGTEGKSAVARVQPPKTVNPASSNDGSNREPINPLSLKQDADPVQRTEPSDLGFISGC
jgi:hypothetical protein